MLFRTRACEAECFFLFFDDDPEFLSHSSFLGWLPHRGLLVVDERAELIDICLVHSPIGQMNIH